MLRNHAAERNQRAPLRSLTLLAALTLGLILCTACGRKESEPISKSPAQTDGAEVKPLGSERKSPPTQAHENALPAPEISWTKPAPWDERPASAMRKATYRVPGKAGDAEVAVFYFGPSSGGAVEANISRWLAQFVNLPADEARRDRLTVHGLEVSTVRVAQGTFSSGMPGGPTTPKENWGLYAAVFETPSGPYFFKMTGPKETVSLEEPRFLELLNSVRVK